MWCGVRVVARLAGVEVLGRPALQAPALAAALVLAGACAADDDGLACDRLERLVVAIPRAEYLRRVAEAPPSTASAATSEGGGGATIGAGTTSGSATADDPLPPIGFDACVAICEELGEVVSPWSCEVTMSDATSVTIACMWTRATCTST